MELAPHPDLRDPRARPPPPPEPREEPGKLWAREVGPVGGMSANGRLPPVLGGGGSLRSGAGHVRGKAPPSPPPAPGLLSPWLAHHPRPRRLHWQEEGTGLAHSLPGAPVLSRVSVSAGPFPAGLPRTNPACPPCGSLPQAPRASTHPASGQTTGPSCALQSGRLPTGTLSPLLSPQELNSATPVSSWFPR